MFLAILAGTLSSGCGANAPDVDKAALYTLESLASEFAFRYRQLNVEAKSAAVRYKPRPQDEKKYAERLARAEQAKNKVTGGAPARKKQTGPPTVDDLLADIDSKIVLIRGVSRSDTCRKMSETITADGSLPEADKKRFTELIGQLGGSH
jgi:hypothetical protein